MSKLKKLTEGGEEEEGEGEGRQKILNYNYQQPLQAFLRLVRWGIDFL